MATPQTDYILADRFLIPEEARNDFDEKVVWLPYCYQPNDRTKRIDERLASKARYGLPLNAFVFCCFNNNYKIRSSTFSVWMEILREVPQGVLWLLEDNSYVAENIRLSARLNGVDPERIYFANRVPLSEHLGRHSLADLFLDTWPYNAHTTASDALWAGLPVLTLAGRSFAARVAGSLLSAIGLPELITYSEQAYKTAAISYARDRDCLRDVRERLKKNRLTRPLFDTPRFMLGLEAALKTMHARHIGGLAPDHIDLGGH
jgi:predicted O-linked N-acetylglucosamine transferase (SPINDLY family)